jgi:hypothetical protein
MAPRSLNFLMMNCGLQSSTPSFLCGMRTIGFTTSILKVIAVKWINNSLLAERPELANQRQERILFTAHFKRKRLSCIKALTVCDVMYMKALRSKRGTFVLLASFNYWKTQTLFSLPMESRHQLQERSVQLFSSLHPSTKFGIRSVRFLGVNNCFPRYLH